MYANKNKHSFSKSDPPDTDFFSKTNRHISGYNEDRKDDCDTRDLIDIIGTEKQCSMQGSSNSNRSEIFKFLVNKSNERMKSVYDAICKKYEQAPEKEPESYDLADLCATSTDKYLHQIIPCTTPVIYRPEYQYSNEELQMYEVLYKNNSILNRSCKQPIVPSDPGPNSEFVDLLKEQENEDSDCKQTDIFAADNDNKTDISSNVYKTELVVAIEQLSLETIKQFKCETKMNKIAEELLSEVDMNIMINTKSKTRNESTCNKIRRSVYNLRNYEGNKSMNRRNSTSNRQETLSSCHTDQVSDIDRIWDQGIQNSDKLDVAEEVDTSSPKTKKIKARRISSGDEDRICTYNLRSFEVSTDVSACNNFDSDKRKDLQISTSSIRICRNGNIENGELYHHSSSVYKHKPNVQTDKTVIKNKTSTSRVSSFSKSPKKVCISKEFQSMSDTSSKPILTKGGENSLTNTSDSHFMQQVLNTKKNANSLTKTTRSSDLTRISPSLNSAIFNKEEGKDEIEDKETSNFLTLRKTSAFKLKTASEPAFYFESTQHLKSSSKHLRLIQSPAGFFIKKAPWTTVQL